MEPFIDELRVAARRLMGLRAALCIVAVAIYGYLLGLVLSDGAAARYLVLVVLLGGLTIAAAAFAMHAAELHAEHLRKRRLDSLYGRDSSS